MFAAKIETCSEPTLRPLVQLTMIRSSWYPKDKSNYQQVALSLGCWDKREHETWDSQLHDQVEVVGTLVDVLQCDDVLVLDPAKQQNKKQTKKSYQQILLFLHQTKKGISQTNRHWRTLSLLFNYFISITQI